MNLRLYTVLFALLPGIAMGAVRGDASRVGVSRAPAAGARAPAVTKKASTNKKTTNASKVAPVKTVSVAESVAEEEYIEALTADIRAYNQAKRTINECIIQRAQDNVKLTVDGKDYYIIKTVFYMRDNKKITASYMDFKVRKEGNEWKILSWGLVEGSEIKGE